MFRRSTGRLLALAAALALPLLSASPGLAADTVSPDVQISGPDQLAPGQQDMFTVDASTATPVAADAAVSLDVLLPARLSAVSVQADGFRCSVQDFDPGQDVQCFGMGFVDAGSVELTLRAGPGSDEFESVRAQFQVDAESAQASKDVDVAPTPSGFDVQVDAPDSVRPGSPFTVTVTASTDHPLTDPVTLNLDLQSPRLTAVTATATGFDCTVRPPEDLGGGSFNPSGADCTADSLTDSVTMTVTATVGPGAAELSDVQATMRSGDFSELATEAVSVLGSDVTTVSGRVWNDLNRNGRQEPGEPGIPGISVASQFSSATTGGDGTYTLTDIERGDTDVLFVAPGKFDFTKPNVGDDQHDSDVTSTERDCEDCVGGSLTLTVAGPTSHVDAGLFDPKVAPPKPGASGPEARTVPTALANTGSPVATLAGIGVLLLAAGVSLTLLQRRRRPTA